MDEPIEVEATVIDEEISPLAGAERWLAESSEKVAERCELYRPPEKIENETQYKDAKAARAACRRDIAELDAERKAMTRRLDDFLKSFRAQVKDVLSPLTDIDARYKALQDAYEELWRTNRQIELAQEYQDIAPDLVPLVSFDAILRRYGSERGKGWLLRTTNIEAAKDALADAVGEIARGEKAIDDLVTNENDRIGIKAGYFQALDLQVALDAAREAKERRERVERLEQERREREEWQRQERERIAREAEERRAAQADESEGQQAEASGGPTEVPAPEAVEPPARSPEIASPAPAAPQARVEVPHAWVISIPSATKAQAQSVADWMKANGIVFDRIYAGTIADAYAKEAANA